jgi:hypothetical protein
MENHKIISATVTERYKRKGEPSGTKMLEMYSKVPLHEELHKPV